MTISLTVIIVEVTNDIHMLLPIMFTILAAKVVGDFFTESIYEMHIKLAGLVLLDFLDLPEEMQLAPASTIMSRKVVFMREIESISRLTRTLTRCEHHGFPVVDDASFGGERFFVGMVTRAKLQVALNEAIAVAREHEPEPEPEPRCEEGSDQDSASAQGGKNGCAVRPRHRRMSGNIGQLAQAIQMMNHVRNSFNQAGMTNKATRVDLRNLLDRSPYVVHELMPLYRVARLFQSMGLRTLSVVDSRYSVVGTITREDLGKLLDPQFQRALRNDLEKSGEKAQMRMLEAKHEAARLNHSGGGRMKHGLESESEDTKAVRDRTTSSRQTLYERDADNEYRLRRRNSEPSMMFCAGASHGTAQEPVIVASQPEKMDGSRHKALDGSRHTSPNGPKGSRHASPNSGTKAGRSTTPTPNSKRRGILDGVRAMMRHSPEPNSQHTMSSSWPPPIRV